MDDADLWREKAERDFDDAEFMRGNDRYSQAAFLYQQAAEKILKAVMVEEGKGVFQSHDCFILAKKVDAPEEVREAGNTISPYYSRTRYPDAGLVELDKSDLKNAAMAAEVVLEWARKQF